MIATKGFEVRKDGLQEGEMYYEDLTWREQEVLQLLSQRLTNREIADQLHLAESTVKDYVGKILGKLGVKNRRQAVELAEGLGLLVDQVSKPEKRTRAYYLPPERTPFVGRADELAVIRQQLDATRLLSLIGPGGIGKTRLALKAAEGVLKGFKDGVFFVSLAPLQSAKDIVQSIAEGLRFPIATHEDPQVQLLRFLESRQILLVMDNFEHLMEGVGIVDEILLNAPGVKVLATSRERLNLSTETIIPIGGMAFPNQVGSIDPLTFDSIALFMQTASKVRPGFEPTQAELEQIAKICQIVEGMPLAIELAAAWLNIINVDEISNELEKDFDILVTEVRDAPSRHRSIRAVFDYSWSMLASTEQEIFMRLSVFRGGFTREAASQVTGASLQLLAAFVNKSFLSHDPDSGRFEIHELLRQYSHEKVLKIQEIYLSSKESHAAYFAEFMQQKWEQLKSHQQMAALAEIEADIENIRSAWRYYLQQKKTTEIWKFIYGLWHVYWIRWWNHAGSALFAEAVAALEGETDEESVALHALALALQSYFMAWLGLSAQGYELAEKSVAVLEKMDHPKALVFAYDCLAVNAYFLYRYSEEIQAIEKMAKIASELEDKWLLAFSLYGQSLAMVAVENYAEARQLGEWNLAIYEEIGDVIGSTTPLIVLGHASLGLGEYHEAKKFYLRCLDISQETGFYYSIQTATKYLCKVSMFLGDLEEARKYLVQSMQITKEIGFVRDIVNLLYEYARLQTARGNLEAATELLALVVQHPASQLYRMIDGRIRDSAEALLANLEDQLPPEVYSAAQKRGQALEISLAVDALLYPAKN